MTESAATALFQGASSPMFVLRGEVVSDVNEAALAWLGQSREDLLGQAMSRAILAEDLPRVLEPTAEEEHRAHVRFRRASGVLEMATMVRQLTAEERLLRVEVNVTRAGEVVTHDETSRMFEQRFFAGFVPMSLTDERTGRFSLVNDAFVAMIGRSREELLGKTSVELGLFESVDRESLIGLVREDGRIVIDRKTIARPGGEVRLIRIASERIELDGKPLLFAVSTDMTDLQAAKRAAEQNAARFAAFMNCGLIGITIFDGERRIVDVNAETERILGRPRAELIGAMGREFVAPGVDSDKVAATLQAGVLTELGFARPNGSIVTVLIGAAPLASEGGAMTFCVDLTDQRALEERLRLAQRMESLGQLAGGVAHDFNNMLSAILGFGSLVATTLRPDDPLQPDIQQIIRAAERAAQLTRQLLAFSRKQMLEPRVVDVSTQVQELEKMLRRLVGEDVSLVLHLAPHLSRVKVDPTQLEQILLNLVLNARDALEQDGTISIETGNVSLDEEYARSHPGVVAGDYVVLAVADDGRGMPPHVRARALDPFFTTKEPGKGTGLGLSTVHGIVQQSGGHLWLYSEVGHGTQIKVYLPVTDEIDRYVRPEPAKPKGGGETILLAEDEDSVRAFVRVALRRAGYNILEAENGGAALLIAEQHKGDIHLLLTDVVMPRMNGRKLAERLEQVRPGLKVIYMSGYTENTIVHRGVVDAGTNFLAKPVALEALRETVRRVLDSPR